MAFGDAEIRQLGNALHNRLLAERDELVRAEITEKFLPALISRLRRRFPNIHDPHLIETAANDALLGYLNQPEKYDPARSDLIHYLYMDARGDLLNLLEKQQRFVELRPFVMEQMNTHSRADNPESLLVENESALINKMKSLVSDPVDREIVALMMDGVRDTPAYSEVLGIKDHPASEQAALVKRHKDRLKAVLKRGIDIRRYMALILLWLAALRGRAEAAARRAAPLASALLAIAVIIGVNIHAWKRIHAMNASVSASSPASGPAMPIGGLAQRNRNDGRYVEKIFFSSNRKAATPNEFHIWMINPDGTGLEQVTFGDVSDETPALSPDGTKLVFSRWRLPVDDTGIEHRSIWVKDLITGEETPITADADHPSTIYTSSEPAWSPDGTQIAFKRANCLDPDGPDKFGRIWIVDYLPTVGVPKQLTPDSGYSRLMPTWSPDGLHIAYMRELALDSRNAIYKINLETGIEEEMIPSVGEEYWPRYSPDGLKIAWTTDRHSVHFGDIYIADVSDPLNTQQRMTASSEWANPAWSPDGRRLALLFVGHRLTEEGLEQLKSFGFNHEVISTVQDVGARGDFREAELVEALTSKYGESGAKGLAYKILQQLQSYTNLWIADLDGGGYSQVTSGPWHDGNPCWGLLFEPYANLGIATSDSHDIAASGSKVTYSILVANSGVGTANNFEVTFSLPPSAKILSCSSTGSGICEWANESGVVTFASLAAGQSATITVIARVKRSAKDGDLIASAIVSSSTPEVNTNDNSEAAAIAVSRPAGARAHQ